MPTVIDLKKELKKAGLKVTGKKSELEERLERLKLGETTSNNKGRVIIKNVEKPPEYNKKNGISNNISQYILNKGKKYTQNMKFGNKGKDVVINGKKAPYPPDPTTVYKFMHKK
jgi:hypothetical protein